MKYKPQIDGLRSVSILPVIFYHMGISSFGGGFLGVDVFFVISGYLITSIISEQIKSGRFTLRNFYERRARRILPALYTVLFVCMIYMFFFQAPLLARDMAQSIVGTVFFVQNILLLVEAGDYFSVSSDLKPLLHTWSLAVEEQFYIFYPLLVVLLYRFRERLIVASLLVLTAISVLLFLGAFGGSTTARFYLLPMRAWELGLGCLVWFLLQKQSLLELKNITVNIISASSFLLLMLAYIFIDDARFYFGAFIASSCAAILLYLLDRQSLVNRLLQTKVLIGIGVLSYSLYLWHQPVIAIFRQNFIAMEVAGNFWIPAGMLLLIFALSIATYFAIEAPIRYRRILKTNSFIVWIFVLTFPLVGFGVAGHLLYGFEELKVNNLPEARQPYYVSYFEEVARNAENGWNELSLGSSNSEPLVIGDSMAKDLVLSLRSVGVGAQLLELDLSCLQEASLIAADCTSRREHIRAASRSSRQVIFASDFASEESFYELAGILRELERTSDVKVLGSFRFFNASTLSYLYARYYHEREIESFFAQAVQDTTLHNTALKGIFGTDNFIDKKALFCVDNQHCQLYNDAGRALFFDELHLTIEGQKHLGAELLKLGVVSASSSDS